MTHSPDLRAHWVAPHVLAWPGRLAADHHLTLHHHVAGSDAGGISPARLELTRGARLPDWVHHRARHLRQANALALPERLDRTELRELVRGHLEVVVTDAQGGLVERTGVQLPGALDALFAEAAGHLPLGVSWQAGHPTLRLWAPTALRVTLHLFDDPQPPDLRRPLHGSEPVAMRRDEPSGVWQVDGQPAWDRRYYLYEVEVVRPATGRLETNVVGDPYARSLSADSRRCQLVDLAAEDLAPPGWWTHPLPPPTEMLPVGYELHVRDHSAHDPSVPSEHLGTYLAFTHPDSHGMRHLRRLAEAGLTHVQLLPVTDFATVPERRSEQLVPHIDVPHDPASERPQALVGATRSRQPQAWGYDPLLPGVPEGSYATEPDGTARIVELRRMVQALHDTGLRVVLDVVFNHTVAAGEHPWSVLDRIVPGYYHRLTIDGALETSTCCPNLAPEHRMVGRYVVDTVRDWARFYRIDGFRFDLMGHHPRDNLLAVRAALDEVAAEDPHRRTATDDAPAILLLGEGWDFGEVAKGARFVQATQRELAGTGIATFDDRLRNGVRGGGPGHDPRAQGWATGLATVPNQSETSDAATVWRRAILQQRWVQIGMAGGLADLELPMAAGQVRRGDEIHFGSAPAGYTRDPVDHVVCVSVHDDETLFDAIALKAPAELPTDTLVRMHQVALAVAVLSLGPVLLHAGCELLRSKSLDRDSYASGDWFNRLDWTRNSHNLGIGLPPAEKNGERWPMLRTVLRQRTPPVRHHLDATLAHLTELLRIRRDAHVYTLRTGAQIRRRVRFPLVDGLEVPGLIVLELAGLGDPDLLVVANARPYPAGVQVPSPADRWALHPVQQVSHDPHVRTTTVVDGRAHVTPWTVAVLRDATVPAD